MKKLLLFISLASTVSIQTGPFGIGTAGVGDWCVNKNTDLQITSKAKMCKPGYYCKPTCNRSCTIKPWVSTAYNQNTTTICNKCARHDNVPCTGPVPLSQMTPAQQKIKCCNTKQSGYKINLCYARPSEYGCSPTGIRNLIKNATRNSHNYKCCINKYTQFIDSAKKMDCIAHPKKHGC